MRLEVYSRSIDQSLWLSAIGSIDIVKVFNSPEVECELLTPTKDYVVTELFIVSRPDQGVTYVEFTFSEDFGIFEDAKRQEKFSIGLIVPAWDNSYNRIDDFMRDNAFIGFTTTYFTDIDKGIGRLGVVYFTCGSWSPPIPELEPTPADKTSDKD